MRPTTPERCWTATLRWALRSSRPSRRSSTVTGRLLGPWPASSAGSARRRRRWPTPGWRWVRPFSAGAGRARNERGPPPPRPAGHRRRGVRRGRDPGGRADLARVVAGAAFRLALLDGRLSGPAAAAPGWLGDDAE